MDPVSEYQKEVALRKLEEQLSDINKEISEMEKSLGPAYKMMLSTRQSLLLIMNVLKIEAAEQPDLFGYECGHDNKGLMVCSANQKILMEAKMSLLNPNTVCGHAIANMDTEKESEEEDDDEEDN